MIKLSELFEIKYGVNKDLNKLNKCDGGINYVSRTRDNNGVSAKVEILEGIEPNPAGTISVALGSSTVLYSFLQEKPYYSGRDIGYLKPKNEMTKNELLFYCMILKENRFKYNYGRQANKTLKDILVPSLNEIPKWVNEISIPKFESQKEAVYKDKEVKKLNIEKWEEFEIKDLFTLTKGKYYPKSSYENGKIPLVSASDTNNGISDYTNLQATYKGNCLTLGKVKMTVFYQEFPFCCSHDVTVLEPKYKFNKYIGIFIKVVLEQNRYRYNYGRQIQLNAAKNVKIKLPVNTDGTPDWDFMEEYIKILPYSSCI
ncbi:restriction endonuclease subunit S [Clostridium tertium]|uniref:restriction endonuclease subunit S n=1 Tax=Clostridium tertium TaxID=1559 RepID=UPI0022E0605D|nr:restriction endonuclease subunit S [Clostridium tertium]